MTNTMSTREVLIAARALIDTPEQWFGGQYPTMNDRHCALTAIGLVASSSQLRIVADEFRTANNIDGIIDFNDSHSHAEVMAAFDRAIAAAGDR